MRVISLKLLREFWEKHPRAEEALRHWYKTTKGADWKRLTDVRKTYAHADGVVSRSGDALTVFNIGGNKFRLIARIRYEYKLVNVRSVMTHDEYDEENREE